MLLNPTVGDLAFNLSTNHFRRMRVVKVTPAQITTIDQLARRTTYWRKNGCEVGNSLNRLTLSDPPEWCKEPKHLVGKPLPEER